MNDTPRTIAVVTTSRADYSHLYWPLRRLQETPGIDLRVIALGAHLSPEFGETVDEIESDGFEVTERIECLLSSDSDTGMAKTIGVAVLSLADCLSRLRPDVLLLIADRYELLAPASVALALRIPIAHVEGGEISEGAIDDAVRNAITKMAHIHFTPTRRAAERVQAMGEQPWRIHRVGAPSLDHLVHGDIPGSEQVAAQLALDDGPLLVVAYHPVTLLENTTAEFGALLQALEARDEQIVFCFPNSDAGSRALVGRVRTLCRTRERAQVCVNLPATTYLGLLRCADALVGNSSSGIMETASLALPTVNIGMRQQGRERAANVIDVAPDPDSIGQAIERALSSEFRAGLAGIENPYGDGNAAERIARVLSEVDLGEQLLIKRA